MKNGVQNLLFKAGRKALSISCQVKNGFRDRITRLQSFKISPGLALFALTLLFLGTFAINTVAGVVLAVGAAIKLKKDGLKDAELTFMNDLERPVFEKFVFLAELKMWLLNQREVATALMSGSGSTVFALLRENADANVIAKRAKTELDPELWTCGVSLSSSASPRDTRD